MTETPNNTGQMTIAEFEQRLPEFFATGTGSISDDPRLQTFLADHPDAAALVRDFQAIVEAASKMFDTEDAEPSDAVWQNIQSGLQPASSAKDSSPQPIAAKATD